MHTILLFTAKYLVMVVGLLAFIYWLKVPRQEKIRLSVFAVVSGLVTLALVKIGAAIFFDPRPFVTHHIAPLYPHAADNGFPSDHTVLTAFIAFTIFSSSKRYGAALLAMALLIGISRVVGNIHSPIDIVGSLAFATAGYFVAILLTPHILKRLPKMR